MKYVFIIFFVAVLWSNNATAQSSMMTEVSYTMLDKLIQTAKDNYPHLKILNKELNIAEANVKNARLTWLDVLQLAYMKNNNVSATHTNSYLLNGYQYGINVNVGSLLQKPTEIKVAKTKYEIAALQRDEYNLTIASAVKERYFTYVQQLSMLKLCMKASQDAESFSKLMGSKFENGEEKFEVYNESLNAYNLQLQKKISAESSMLIAKAQLEELIGKPLEELDYWHSDSVKK